MLSNAAKTKIATIQEELEGSVNRIRDDATRTAEWKQRELATYYLRAKQAHSKVVADDAVVQRDAQRRLEQKLFGPGVVTPLGDLGAAIISRRDAGDRVAVVENESAAMELLRRAERSGDEPLARAVAERALDEKWVEVGNAFISTRPDLAPSYEELWNQRVPSTAQQIGEGFATMIQPPRELDGLPDYKLSEISEAGTLNTAPGSIFSR